MTITWIGMNPCKLPHNSEHWPWRIPLELQLKHKDDNLPGTQSILKPKHGTVKLCITSTADKLALYFVPEVITKLAKVCKISPTATSELCTTSEEQQDQYHCKPTTSTSNALKRV